MAVVGIESTSVNRARGVTPLRTFGFWTEYRNHQLFRVSVLGRDDRVPFVYEVRSFGNMTASVRAFAECVSMPGEVTRGMADIYRTGYGMVNGFNVRVTAL